MSQSLQKNLTQEDDSYNSKKKKLHLKTEFKNSQDEETFTSKKKKLLGTGTHSVSKSKISTHKKSEVTFSDNVQQISDKENLISEDGTQTPFKQGKSPSKQGLKSVKEHIKTPYSKIKDQSDSDSTPLNKQNDANSNSKYSLMTSYSKNLIAQNKSSVKLNLNYENPEERARSRGTTPGKESVTKQDLIMASRSKSKSKTPLRKIEEVEEVDKNHFRESTSNNLIPVMKDLNSCEKHELNDNVSMKSEEKMLDRSINHIESENPFLAKEARELFYDDSHVQEPTDAAQPTETIEENN